MNWFYEQTSDGQKRIKRDVIWFVVLFLVSTISFALGYLAGREFNHSPIIIEKSSDSS